MTKTQIAAKAATLRDDLAILVNTCNKSGDYHLAQIAQSCLQQVAQLCERAEQEAEQEAAQSGEAGVASA